MGCLRLPEGLPSTCWAPQRHHPEGLRSPSVIQTNICPGVSTEVLAMVNAEMSFNRGPAKLWFTLVSSLYNQTTKGTLKQGHPQMEPTIVGVHRFWRGHPAIHHPGFEKSGVSTGRFRGCCCFFPLIFGPLYQSSQTFLNNSYLRSPGEARRIPLIITL